MPSALKLRMSRLIAAIVIYSANVVVPSTH
jgi:hypothetical protein